MAKQPNLANITSPYGGKDAINNNTSEIQQAFLNTLSRDGSSPNNMEADLDMDSNDILNVNTLEAQEITLAGHNLSPLTTAADDADAARIAAEAAADAAIAASISAMAAQNTMLKPRGNWATATAYALGDVVYVTVAQDASNGGSSYFCTTAHTSSALFATDLATKWGLLALKGATGAGSGDMLKSENLSGLSSYPTARTNMGLGTIATQAASSVTITGGSITGITPLGITEGGTGASTPAGARTALGLEIGVNVQPQDTNLTEVATPGASGTVKMANGTGNYVDTQISGALGTVMIGKGAGIAPAYLTAGTSGQYLKSNGAADPSWATPSQGGHTLLGTISFPSGSSQSLNSLDLTPYKFVLVTFQDIRLSATGSAIAFMGDQCSSTNAAATDNFRGDLFCNLATGYWTSICGFMNSASQSSSVNTYAGSSGLSTASTTITISRLLSAGSFTQGTASVYGVT